MIFPNSLGVLLTSIQLRRNQHGKPDEVLYKKHRCGDDAEIGMYGVEVRVVVLHFVVFNDCHASDERKQGHHVESSVNALSQTLLLECMGGLQGEDGLYQHQNRKGLGERMSREEDERLGEDTGPDEDDEKPDAYLRDDTSAFYLNFTLENKIQVFSGMIPIFAYQELDC